MGSGIPKVKGTIRTGKHSAQFLSIKAVLFSAAPAVLFSPLTFAAKVILLYLYLLINKDREIRAIYFLRATLKDTTAAKNTADTLRDTRIYIIKFYPLRETTCNLPLLHKSPPSVQH